MEEQQYQGKYTKVMLQSIELGDRTVAQLTEERERHIAVRGKDANDQYLASQDEALAILQQQTQQ